MSCLILYSTCKQATLDFNTIFDYFSASYVAAKFLSCFFSKTVLIDCGGANSNCFRFTCFVPIWLSMSCKVCCRENFNFIDSQSLSFMTALIYFVIRPTSSLLAATNSSLNLWVGWNDSISLALSKLEHDLNLHYHPLPMLHIRLHKFYP